MNSPSREGLHDMSSSSNEVRTEPGRIQTPCQRKLSSASFGWPDVRFAETGYQERGADLLAKATDLGEV